MSNAAVVLIAVLMVAAGPSPRATAGPVATAGLALEGPAWRLTSLSGQYHDALAAISRGVTARFGTGHVAGFSGCNQYAGTYAVRGDRLTVGPLAGTMMACEEPAMKIENAFRGAFAGEVRYAIEEDRLTLTSASATLVFQAVPPATLEGGTWEITAFNNGRHGVVGVVGGTTLTLSFGDGAVVGGGGCNTYRAVYKSDGDRVTIGSLVTTRKACAGEGVMEQEQQVLAALESATSWAIDGDLLDMHRADGERALMARRRPE